MRIEKISFKNINSLKGEHEIDFNATPLKDAGIFAIIGPTGSGKSTILDVITLALYNQVPRVNAKGVTDTVIENTGSILTRFTDNAYASIVYSTREGQYESRWSIRRKRTGKLESPHMEIIDLNEGKVLDLKKSEVPKENERLIGLNYDQFVKSIILSQGEFSKFLKANKNERGTLLEKITGTEIYRKLGAKVYEKFKDKEKTINDNKNRVDMVTLLSEEEIKELNQLVKTADKTINGLTTELTQLLSLKQIKEQLLELTNQQNQIKESMSALLSQEKGLKQSFHALSIYEKLNPYVADLTKYQDAKEKSKAAQSTIENNKADIVKYQKAQTKVMAEMSDLLQSKVSIEDFMSKMKDLEAKVTKMDASLLSLKEQGIKLGSNIKKVAASKSFASAKELATKSKSADYNKVVQIHKQNLSTQLKTLKLDPETSVDAVRKTLEKSQATLAAMKDQLLKTEQLEKLQVEEQAINKRNQNDQKILTSLEPELEKCQKQIIDLKESLKSIRLQKEKSAALFQLNDYRSALKSGEECPLCGSLEHPLAAHQEAQPTGFDTEIQKTEKAIKIEEQQLGDLTKNQTALLTSIANQQKQIKDGQTQLSSLHTWFKQEKLAVKPLDQVKQEYETLSSKIQNINLGQLSLEEYQWLLEIEEAVNELQVIGKDYSEQSKARKAIFEGDNLADITNKLQNQFTDLKSKIETSQALLHKTTADHEAELKTQTHLETALQPKLSKIGFDNLELAQSARLSEAEIAKFKSEKESHQKNKISLETSQKKNKTDIDKLIKADDPKVDLNALLTQIQEKETSRKDLSEKIGAAKNQLKSDTENKKKVGKIQKELEKQTIELDSWALLSRLIGDKTGAKFANYAQNITLRQLLALANKRLEKLFDRYFLDMPTTDGELMIRDKYQGDIERGVSTLSGGETFMISLALALSLSDMASKNVALESLFIDEGFSTLDPEMLDLAMNTLDRIQSESQKTVGIISHVESLKNRIEVQIQLQKDAQGYSTIHIEG
jgi:exonuclease SbcC